MKTYRVSALVRKFGSKLPFRIHLLNQEVEDNVLEPEIKSIVKNLLETCSYEVNYVAVLNEVKVKTLEESL